MALQEFQLILLKLYTNEKFQKEFLSRATQALERYRLSEREKRALLALPASELRVFHGELRAKREMIMNKIWQMSSENSPVIASCFYTSNPIIFLKDFQRERKIIVSEGEFYLLQKIASQKEKISLPAILKAYSASENISLSDLFRLARNIRAHRLTGKGILIL